MLSKLTLWIPQVIIITALCALIYLTAQQTLRQGANDPQIQLSEDIAHALDNNQYLPSLIPSATVDLTRSLSTFVMVYDNSNKIIATNATLNNKNPELPAGVLDYTRNNNQDRITWEPSPGIRIAAVLTKYDKGIVLVGRSLRETEKREHQLESYAKTIWIGTLILSFIATLLFVRSPSK